MTVVAEVLAFTRRPFRRDLAILAVLVPLRVAAQGHRAADPAGHARHRLRDQDQLELCVDVFASQTPLAPRREPSDDPTEYWADNDQYPALDAWVLAGMLTHLQPSG
jgi:hypothetical protein